MLVRRGERFALLVSTLICRYLVILALSGDVTPFTPAQSCYVHHVSFTDYDGMNDALNEVITGCRECVSGNVTVQCAGVLLSLHKPCPFRRLDAN